MRQRTAHSVTKEEGKMSKRMMNNLHGMLQARTAVFLIFLLWVYAGNPSNLTAQTPPKAEASSPAGARQEGIQVHGHWTIDVSDPDGTLVTHREFENDLTLDGRVYLTQLLTQRLTLGPWFIKLTGMACADNDSIDPHTGCIIFPVGTLPSDMKAASPSTLNFPTLTITVPDTGPNAYALVLNGSATAGTNGGSINTVATEHYVCLSSIAPANCGISPFQVYQSLFTQASPPTVTVASNQTIGVTVILSFQ